MSLNASYGLGTSYDQRDILQRAEYTGDVVNQGEQGFEEGQAGEEGYQHDGEEDCGEEYGQDSNVDMNEKQLDYSGDGYQDEVLDIHINEPLDGEFQVSSKVCLLTPPHTHTHRSTEIHTEDLTILLHPFVFQR